MTPSDLGFRLPAEWEPQSAVWLSWPVHPENWPGEKQLARVQRLFTLVASHISRYQAVRINAASDHHASILRALEHAEADTALVEIFDHPTNDVWCRDHGPLFIKNDTTGETAITGWNFNGWGKRFAPFDLDAAIPGRVAEVLNLRFFENRITLEGGAIEPNGRGLLVTTEAVLLDPERNPELRKTDVESELRSALGIQSVCWLRRGIAGDDTGGHVDDMVRFVNEHTVLAATEADPSHPNYAILEDNLRRLREFKPSLNVIELPMPAAIDNPGGRLPQLPASYVNFLITNEAVLIPVFNQPASDARAISTISSAIPDRKVIPVNCLDLVAEGGALHCVSMQQPA